jgi:hypothetical protein
MPVPSGESTILTPARSKTSEIGRAAIPQQLVLFPSQVK